MGFSVAMPGDWYQSVHWQLKTTGLGAGLPGFMSQVCFRLCGLRQGPVISILIWQSRAGHGSHLIGWVLGGDISDCPRMWPAQRTHSGVGGDFCPELAHGALFDQAQEASGGCQLLVVV